MVDGGRNNNKTRGWEIVKGHIKVAPQIGQLRSSD